MITFFVIFYKLLYLLRQTYCKIVLMTNNFKDQLRFGLTQISKCDPIMADLISNYGPPTFKPHRNYYEELISSIVSQQLSVKAARTIWSRVLDIYSGQTPTPEQILTTPRQTLRSAGISNAKVSYITDLALHISEGRLKLENLDSLDNDTIIDSLTNIKGIGVWSAHMFMIFSLGRLDVLPWGDLGIRKSAKELYNLQVLPDKTMLEKIALYNKWAPYQSLAAWYLWKSLDNS